MAETTTTTAPSFSSSGLSPVATSKDDTKQYIEYLLQGSGATAPYDNIQSALHNQSSVASPSEYDRTSIASTTPNTTINRSAAFSSYMVRPTREAIKAVV